jgi:Leucine-rich repeat (LRR) protein
MKKFLFGLVFCFGIFGFGGISDGLAFSEGEKKFLEAIKDKNPEASFSDSFGEKCDAYERNDIVEVVCNDKNEIVQLNLNHKNIKTIPSEIRYLSSLSFIDLRGNNLSSVPSEIGTLKFLKYLNLTHNSFQSFPIEVINLDSLISLRLSHNKLEAIPKEIQNFQSLNLLSLGSNNIKFIPLEITKIKSLTELYLNHNQISLIPSEIENLVNLKQLRLYNNQLIAIPKELGNLINLNELYLQDNNIKVIPSEIGNLLNLQMLYLYNNDLEEIPDEVLNIPSLIDIKYNTLNSSIKNLFSDLSSSHQNFDAINFVKEKNIVNGYEENGETLFKPENKINRAEFMKIVLLAKYSQEEIDSAAHAGFTDIPEGEWYESYANFGKEKGFIKGYKQPDGTFTFGGTQNIRFSEAAKIVVNILLEPTESSSTGNWYDSFVQKLQKKNVQTYPAEKEITRGEMAQIIFDILK